MSILSFLDKAHTFAPPGFNRWLVPPAALAIHLAIGQAYAFSVFNEPLSRLIGITRHTPDDWEISTIGWVFSLAMVFLGLSAAVFGKWLERAGPRQAMLVSACCFGGGFLVSALGVYLHSLWLLYLGYGVLGGIGLGIGYISPVSTLLRWFPDRPGLATGLAIMGFGGGAMIGGPLGVALMRFFQSGTSTGVGETFLVMGAGYFLFMLFGAMIVRLPPDEMSHSSATRRVPVANVSADAALATPQFYLLWGVLFLNVTAGIGILGQASLMIQEMFLAGLPGEARAAAAGGFVGLLSLFNMGGRFFWSSLSDRLGRRATYFTFFLLGAVLYAAIPTTRQTGSVVLFVAIYAVILSMYGGGFATIPAYLRDLYGTLQVGAIHGRLLTAWSAAGIVGPVVINYLRQYQIARGVPAASAYDVPLYLMAGLLVVGAVCNFLVQPVAARHHAPSPVQISSAEEAPGSPLGAERGRQRATFWLLVCWMWVGVPLAWGVWRTVMQSLLLFG